MGCGQGRHKTYPSSYVTLSVLNNFNLHRIGITLIMRFDIRFWCDAPADARARRRVEQQQIRHWLPPFNKECRQRWQTPFQSDLH